MRPFNLGEAKAGAEICTEDGKKAHFIAHVPEVVADERVLARVGELIFGFNEAGVLCKGQEGCGLRMADIEPRYISDQECGMFVLAAYSESMYNFNTMRSFGPSEIEIARYALQQIEAAKAGAR